MLERLRGEQAEIEEHLKWVREQAAEHLKKHGGIPATSCHKCIVYKQGVIADQANLADVRREIQAIISKK